MKKLNNWAIVVVFVLATMSPANAALLTWTLDRVTFDDGTTATGSFDYDASVDNYVNVNISVMNGTLSAYTYQDNGIFVGVADASMVDFVEVANFTRYLRLVFDAPLDNAGGLRNLVLGNVSWECNNCGVIRYITGGTVSASPIPLPAAVWLFATALAGLGFSTRKK